MATNDIPTPASAVDTPTEVMAVNWFGQGPTAKDLWAEVERSSTPEEAAAIYAKVEAELGRTQTMAGKYGTPDLEVPVSRLAEHSDELTRIARRLRRVISEGSKGPTETPAQRALREGEGAARPRTNAARKAFLLSEAFGAASSATLSEIAASAAPPAPAIPPPARTNAAAAAAARLALREAAAAARASSVARFIAETVYRAIPFDEAEKAPHRDVIVLEAFGEASRVLASGARGNGALAEAAALVAEAVGDCAEAEVCVGLVAAAAADPAMPLSRLVSESAAMIESRVVAAVAADRARAARLERLAESARGAGGSEGADPELRLLRATRALDKAPTLLEALFIANRKALSESVGAGLAVDSDLVVAESVGQYTVLEALSAFGLVSLGAGMDLEATARRIARAA
jgi:hypothetical protein